MRGRSEKPHRSLRFLGAVLTLLAGLTACSHDDPAAPPKFAVRVTVVDARGAPLPGLLASVASNNPYLQDGPFAKAMVIVPFQTAVESRVRVSVADIEGATVAELYDGVALVGRYTCVWDGRDAGGIHQPSSRYTVRMVATDPGTGEVLFEAREDVLMALLDATRAPVGVTDSGGRVVFADRRLFPHLYDREAMTARNENGEPMGPLEPTPSMLFCFADTAAGRSRIFSADVTAASSFRFTWPDDPQSLATALAPPVRSEAEPPPVQPFQLGPIHPNPFN
jgi:hypothetical protein